MQSHLLRASSVLLLVCSTSTSGEPPTRTPAYKIRPEATVGAFGVLSTDAKVYRPLDTVTIGVRGRAAGDAKCRIRVCDPNQQPYFETEMALTDNRAETR